ncbi:MAG: drug efflux transport system ATP-binding protein [Cyanobacteriota bacterium erpe_2018_sw_39hr_WHONDRS-SW48-000098_B_bin.30]|nr:drug efflux transport system ATP-binding protein [Cyanobacteriota bacterium erpe_2018_sw_39hr_WHONDRS-SW48-000098_B_bin.30]
MDASTVVQVHNLRKDYGSLTAVKDIDFAINSGEIFGLIGPDGAGKTTSFHILGGVLEQTGGDVLVLGGKPRDMRLEIGYLTQQFSLYLDLSLIENLRYVAGLREVAKADFDERAWKYLKLMSLDKFPDRLAGQLSGGMKQKLALCCALVARPKLLLLDEPTTGVDPVSRREFWDLLSTVTQEGVTVAVATPYLDEAERCNRLILMHEGQVKETGSPQELKDNLGLHRLEIRSGRIELMERRLIGLSHSQADVICDVQTFGDRLDVLAKDVSHAQSMVEAAAKQDGISDLVIELQEPTLENVFVNRLRAEKNSSDSDLDRKPFPFAGSFDAASGNDFKAIEAKGVRKTFGNFVAVKDVSLEVGYGQIYGLLGANGAGKTTTIKILCGLLMPTQGKMALCGQVSNLRSEALRQRLGYMSQKFTLYDDLTIMENLEFYCGVYCVPDALKNERIAWVLRSSDLTQQGGMLAGKLPGGWKQRLSFGAAVLHQPEVLFLDEPTSGVDPLARREMWKLIRDFARQGTAVLVTTHFLEEAEYCNNLGFMVAGALVAEGSPTDIKASQPGKLFELNLSNTNAGYALLKSKLASWRTSMFADALHVVLDDPAVDLPGLRAQIESAGLKLNSLRQLPYSLEDAFISIVQRASGKVA